MELDGAGFKGKPHCARLPEIFQANRTPALRLTNRRFCSPALGAISFYGKAIIVKLATGYGAMPSPS